MRDPDQEIPATSWNAYRSPSNLSNGSSFSFGVDYLNKHQYSEH